jgi:hypothetical protein
MNFFIFYTLYLILPLLIAFFLAWIILPQCINDYVCWKKNGGVEKLTSFFFYSLLIVSLSVLVLKIFYLLAFKYLFPSLSKNLVSVFFVFSYLVIYRALAIPSFRCIYRWEKSGERKFLGYGYLGILFSVYVFLMPIIYLLFNLSGFYE